MQVQEIVGCGQGVVLSYRHGRLLIRQRCFQEAIQGAMQKAELGQGTHLPEASGLQQQQRPLEEELGYEVG